MSNAPVIACLCSRSHFYSSLLPNELESLIEFWKLRRWVFFFFVVSHFYFKKDILQVTLESEKINKT